MSYLGRPSAGDSPFAIGQKAFFDTTSPQAPSQRNPTPRGGAPAMNTPQPYGGGDVSGEARRRYEERYNKRKQEEAAAAAAAGGGSGGGGNMGVGGGGGGGGGSNQPPQHHQGSQQSNQLPHQYQGGSMGPPQQQQQQYQQRPPQAPPMTHQQSYGPTPVPPGGYPSSPQPQQQQHSGAPPTWSGFSTSPNPQQSQPPPANLHPQRSSYSGSGSGAPLTQQRSNSPYDRNLHSPSLGQGEQRWSQLSGGGGGQSQQQGGPQWSQKAAPPPPQDFRGRPGSAQSGNIQQQGGSNQGHHQSQSGSGVSVSSQQVQGDDELRQMFEQFDMSRSGQLTSYDLQRLLAKDSLMEDPREDAVKMLMNIFDTDRSGSINFMEFEGLYRYIQDWHGIFQRFDRDASGLIDRKELHQALLGFGFSLPTEMVRKLEKRFAPPPKLMPGGNVVQRKGISFDRFLMACVTVKHYTEGFRRLDPNNTGKITVDYNSYMDMVLDAP